jgi:peptidoglycan/xylan/chitin deacetylase (PgdA/CDA1 family)
LYHRVVEPTSDPWNLCVSPAHFREHLQILRRRSRVLSLNGIVGNAISGNWPEDAVAITFDDGYADNIAAASIMEDMDIPATIFVSTGYIGGQREFWWDELDRLLLQPGVFPPTLTVKIEGDLLSITLGDTARYTREAADRHQRWRAYEDDPPSPRQAAYLALWERMVTQTDAVQRNVLDQLADQSGAVSMTRGSHRPMTQEEIAALARSPLIEIGAHTVSHPALPSLPREAQRSEITSSKETLEEIVGRPVDGFSYPHGRYTSGSIDLVREAGFQYACAVRPSKISANLSVDRCDPYVLPRIVVPDWDGATFEHKLLNGFEG